MSRDIELSNIPLSSSRLRCVSSLRLHSGLYHRFSFSDRTGSVDVWRVFLAASSLFMGSTSRARHGHTKRHVHVYVHVRLTTRSEPHRKRRCLWMLVKASGLSGFLEEFLSRRRRLNNLRVIVKFRSREMAILYRFISIIGRMGLFKCWNCLNRWITSNVPLEITFDRLIL